MAGTPDLLTANEVALTFRVSRSTVSRWVRDGEVDVIRLPGGTLRFRREDIERLMVPVTPEPETAA